MRCADELANRHTIVHSEHQRRGVDRAGDGEVSGTRSERKAPEAPGQMEAVKMCRDGRAKTN